MLEGIDEIMKPLITAMNSVSYIETFSCCQGHPEESAVKSYGYAVANVVFEIKDEPRNLVTWFSLAQEILRQRKAIVPAKEFAFIIEKKYSLNEDNNLGWSWGIRIQATAKTVQECRQGLDAGIEFLKKIFTLEANRKN